MLIFLYYTFPSFTELKKMKSTFKRDQMSEGVYMYLRGAFSRF